MTDLNPYMPVPDTVRNGYDMLNTDLFEQAVAALAASDSRQADVDHACLVVRTLHMKLLHATRAIAVTLSDGTDADTDRNTAAILADWREADYKYWGAKQMAMGTMTEVAFVWRIRDEEGHIVHQFFDKATTPVPPQIGQFIDVGVPGMFFSVTAVISRTTDRTLDADCVAVCSCRLPRETIDYLTQRLSEWKTPEADTEAASVISRFAPDWI